MEKSNMYPNSVNSEKGGRFSFRKILMIVIAVVVVLALIGGGYYWFGIRAKANRPYKAIFLSTNQVYFGKIAKETNKTIILEDIYYLQTGTAQSTGTSPTPTPSPSAGASSDQNQLSLVKLGKEIHGPQDRMEINRDQVLFIETLTDGSKVVQAIKDQKNK